MLKRTTLVGITAILLITIMMFSLSLGGASAQDAPTVTPAVAEMGTGSTHIAFWNGLTGSDGVTLNEMLAQYATENTDISITTEIIPWATLYTKLQAAFVASEAPDVFLIRVAQLPQFVSYGVIQDLSSWYTSGGGFLPDDDFAQPAFDRLFVDGIPYAVPLDNHGRGAWINLDHFEAAGLDPNVYPETYEEAVALFQQLTLDANGNNAASPDFDPENVVQWGYTPEWLWTDWLSFSWGSGGGLVSEDGTTATINAEGNVLALQRMYDLIYEYHVAPAPGGWDSWGAFGAGTLSIIPTGTWFRNYAATLTDINSQAWPVLPIGEERSAWIGSHVFVVPTSTTGTQLDAVRDMIQWVSENQVLWAASGQVPARISAQEALDPENYPSNILLGETFQQYGHLEPPCISLLDIEPIMNAELSAALNDQKSPQQALDDAQVQVQAVLDRQPC
jgi:ABC-type glycerol-3-phosphate transport system substrate-binding protein